MVFAVDPGTKMSAWVRHGERITGDYVDNPTLLVAIRNGLGFQPGDSLVIEPIRMGGMIAGAETFDTAMFVGMLLEAAFSKWRYEVKRFILPRPGIVAHLVGAKIKGKVDAQIRQALIDRFGGDSKAIGGKKCRACKGRGLCGRPPAPCKPCRGQGLETPPGPLHGLAGHLWSALAVAVTFADRPDLAEEII